MTRTSRNPNTVLPQNYTIIHSIKYNIGTTLEQHWHNIGTTLETTTTTTTTTKLATPTPTATATATAAAATQPQTLEAN